MAPVRPTGVEGAAGLAGPGQEKPQGDGVYTPGARITKQPALKRTANAQVRSSNLQRRSIPPYFRWALTHRSETSYYRDHEEALRWYQEDLVDSDVNTTGPADFEDLQTVLLNDANPGPAIDPHKWFPVKELGQGGYGAVTLWQRESRENGHPPEQVACKDCKFDSWFQDYNSEGNLTRRLNVAGCPNVIKIFDWMPISLRQTSRMVLEYCSNGDLSDIYHYYKASLVIFPEAFIWHVFHSIATAICYNARGTTEEEPLRGWSEIIHRDIKEGNILVGEVNVETRNPYPVLKLADFGLAYSVPNAPVRNLKRHFWSSGTQGYCAPEASSNVRSDPVQAPDSIASPRSDIYSLGCIIMKFLRLARRGYHSAQWRQLDLELGWSYTYFPYSQTLFNLTMRCLDRDARQRPDPLELVEMTASGLEFHLEDDIRQKATIPFVGDVLWRKEAQEQFKLNMSGGRHFLRQNDWFWRHSAEMADLKRCTENLAEQAIPPEGMVALCGGMMGFVPLEYIVEHVAGRREPKEYLEEMIIWDRYGRKKEFERGKEPMRYVGSDHLVVPVWDENWRENWGKRLLEEENARRERGEPPRTRKEREAILREKGIVPRTWAKSESQLVGQNEKYALERKLQKDRSAEAQKIEDADWATYQRAKMAQVAPGVPYDAFQGPVPQLGQNLEPFVTHSRPPNLRQGFVPVDPPGAPVARQAHRPPNPFGDFLEQPGPNPVISHRGIRHPPERIPAPYRDPPVRAFPPNPYQPPINPNLGPSLHPGLPNHGRGRAMQAYEAQLRGEGPLAPGQQPPLRHGRGGGAGGQWRGGNMGGNWEVPLGRGQERDIALPLPGSPSFIRYLPPPSGPPVPPPQGPAAMGNTDNALAGRLMGLDFQDRGRLQGGNGNGRGRPVDRAYNPSAAKKFAEEPERAGEGSGRGRREGWKRRGRGFLDLFQRRGGRGGRGGAGGSEAGAGEMV